MSDTRASVAFIGLGLMGGLDAHAVLASIGTGAAGSFLRWSGRHRPATATGLWQSQRSVDTNPASGTSMARFSVNCQHD